MHFKQKIYIFASLLLVLSCADDDDLPVTPPYNTCISGNELTISDITDIPEGVTFNRLVAEISGAEWKTIETVEASYSNGQALLSLPTDLPASELMKAVVTVTDEDGKTQFDPSGYWRADTKTPNTLVAGLRDIFAYYNDERVGRVYLSDCIKGESNVGKSWVYYHYVDEALELSGTYGSYRRELTFRKGWNPYINYNITEETISGAVLSTTDISDEMPLVWHFESNFN